MLKALRNIAIAVGVLAGGSYLYYRFGLNDETKNKLQFAYNAAQESYKAVSSTIDSVVGIKKEEDASSAQAAARAQWEKIGY